VDEPRGAGEEPEYEPNPGWRWAGGDDPSTGRLWGGCRALVEWQLTIDRYLPDPDDLDGAVLALATADDLPGPEDVAATLVCLGERGLLEGFSAVLVGRPPGRSYLREPPREERERPTENGSPGGSSPRWNATIRPHRSFPGWTGATRRRSRRSRSVNG